MDNTARLTLGFASRNSEFAKSVGTDLVAVGMHKYDDAFSLGNEIKYEGVDKGDVGVKVGGG